MKHVTTTPKPDLNEWSLDSSEKLSSVINEMVAEALHYSLEDEGTRISLPVVWSEDTCEQLGWGGGDGLGGPNVEDPLTVYLRIGILSEVEAPTYKFSLRDEVEASLEYFAEDGSYSFGFGRLSVALRELADEIDAAMKI